MKITITFKYIILCAICRRSQTQKHWKLFISWQCVCCQWRV